MRALAARKRRHLVANAQKPDSKASIASTENVGARDRPFDTPRIPRTDARVASSAITLLLALAVLPSGGAAAQSDREPQEPSNHGGQHGAGVGLSAPKVPARSNGSPEITSDSSFAVAENTTLVGTLTATDDDTAAGDLAWSIAGGADASHFSVTSGGVLTFASAKNYESPDDTDTDGTYAVMVQVSDGTNSDTANLVVELTNVNEAPVATATAEPSTVAAGRAVRLRSQVTEPDHAPQSWGYYWEQVDSSGYEVELRWPRSQHPTFTAPSALPRTHRLELEFLLRVTDQGGLSGEDTVKVRVVNNSEPTGAPTVSGTAQVGETLTASRSGIADADGLTNATFSYQWVRREDPYIDFSRWGHDNSISGATDSTYTLVTADVGKWIQVRVTFTDDHGVEETVASAVTEQVSASATAAPSITTGSALSAAENGTSVGTLTATDEDTAADDLVWSIGGGADASHFSLTSGGVLTFTSAKNYESPDDSDADGTYAVTVEVADGVKSDTANLAVALTNVNEAPTADAGSDQSGVPAGSAVGLDGSGSDDPDAGETLTYAWAQTDKSGYTVTLSDAAAVKPTFAVPSDAKTATLSFELTVTDAGGLSDADTVSVSVVELPAVSITGPSNAVTEGGNAVFTLTRTGDSAAALTVDVSVTETGSMIDGDPPTKVAFGADSATATLTVKTDDDENDEDDSTVKVTISAGTGYGVVASGGSAAVTVADNDEAALIAPSITTGSALSAAENGTSVGTLTATDEDTAADDLVWSIGGGADASHFSLTSGGVLTFTSAKNYESPDDSDADGTYAVTVEVADGVKSDTANLAVALTNVNEAPTADAGSDQSGVPAGSAVGLDGSGSDDPDAGETLTYAWAQTDKSGYTVTLSDAAAVKPTFAVPSDAKTATLSFELTVTDAGGLSDADTVSVSVVELPAVSITGPSNAVTEGGNAVFTLTRTGDSAAALTVDVSVTETGSMIDGDPPTKVAFGADSATATLTVKTDDDENDEDDSTVKVTISAGTGYGVVASGGSAAVTVADNDEAATNSALALAAYHIDDGRLEVRWSWPKDTEASSFTIQWKAGEQDYDSSRQLRVSASVIKAVEGYGNVSFRRYAQAISGLTNGTEYTLRIVATDAHNKRVKSPEVTRAPQTTGEDAQEFVENEIISVYSGAHPWLRAAWNYARSRVEAGRMSVRWVPQGTNVSVVCILTGGWDMCYVTSIHLGVVLLRWTVRGQS